MNFIIVLSSKNKKIQQTFVSLKNSGKLGRGNITFAKDWVTALGYAAIDPLSCMWVDWDTIGRHFHYFYQELHKVNRWMPYILIIDKENIEGKVCSGTEQLFTLIPKDKLEDDFDEIFSQISSYFDMVASIPKAYKNYLRPNGFSSFTWNSSVMFSLYRNLIKIAPTDFTVLITGSSGSGKELAAKTIHELSPRKNKRFQSLNCAAIPDTLLESELFGYEKGAFTDARHAKPGKFELADGGTVFLDEIGDMPSTLQSKLLRVLEEHTIERLGCTTAKEIDIRLLSATHQNLIDCIAHNTFREDLYYRLNVFPVQIPSLAHHKSDIPLLTLTLLNRLEKRNNLSIRSISWGLIERLKSLPLKGNVRELENILIRVIFQSSDMNLSAAALDVILQDDHQNVTSEDPSVPFPEAVNPLWELERMAIKHALSTLNGNITKVASQLEISRSALYRKMKKYQLSETED